MEQCFPHFEVLGKFIYSFTIELRCPPGVPQALCTALPCSITRCSAFPDAICLSDFCGGCNARFFQSDGTEVTNKCSGIKI